MAEVHAQPQSMVPQMDSLSLRYFGLALVDPTDKYLGRRSPFRHACGLISNACFPASSSSSLLLPLSTAAPLRKPGEPTGLLKMLACIDSIVSLLIAIVPLLVVPTPTLVVAMPIV